VVDALDFDHVRKTTSNCVIRLTDTGGSAIVIPSAIDLSVTDACGQSVGL